MLVFGSLKTFFKSLPVIILATHSVKPAAAEAVITAASALKCFDILFDAIDCNSSIFTKFVKISLAALIDFEFVIEAPILVIKPLTLIIGVRLFFL